MPMMRENDKWYMTLRSEPEYLGDIGAMITKMEAVLRKTTTHYGFLITCTKFCNDTP